MNEPRLSLNVLGALLAAVEQPPIPMPWSVDEIQRLLNSATYELLLYGEKATAFEQTVGDVDIGAWMAT